MGITVGAAGGRRALRLAVAVAVTLLSSVVWVAPASAHAELQSSDPAAGAVLTVPPIESS